MSSGEQQQLDQKILEHLARYRLSFQEILSALFFDGARPQKTLNELKARGLITTQGGFEGNRRGYKLTKEGRSAISARRRAADNLGSMSQDKSLAILAFCFLKQRSRILLQSKEWKSLIGADAKKGHHHCIENGGHATCIHHVYVPGVGTPVDDVLRQTREHIPASLAVTELAPWLKERLYIHTILVDRPNREADLNALLDEATLDEFDQRPIRKVARIHVERVPMHSSLEEALRALAEEYKAA